MRELLMVRYGEIYLKGQNRPFFLKLLVSRIKEALKGLGTKVWLSDSRIYVSDYADREACISKIKKVFGVHSLCVAIEMPKDNFEDIAVQAAAMMKGFSGTFKVLSRRSDKTFQMDSMQLSRELGGRILAANHSLKVDVKNPNHLLNVEIRDHAYLYCEVIEAVGGMPIGSNGKAALLLSGGIDSPVAGYMVAKRGVELCAVHYYSFPYTGERSKEKVIELAKKLATYSCGVRLYIVPFTEIQMQIHKKCPDDFTTLIMRRFMMRIAGKVAEAEDAKALITGESIGQVASQTMDALCCTDRVVDMPVFRPLIGFDKADIIDYAKKIDTFELSSLPYEDCCTVFTPRHPVTHPKIKQAEMAEKHLDIDKLVEKAALDAEIIEL